MLFLILKEGLTAADSRPILVTADPQIVREVAQIMLRRLGLEPPPRLRSLKRDKAAAGEQLKVD
jgi:hypothetical protein